MESAVEVSRMVAAISVNSRGQSGGIGEIGAAVRQMDEATRQNAALVDEVADAGAALHEQADGLRRLVGFFRFTGEMADAEA